MAKMLLLLMAYLVAPVVAGHGLLPMGFLLIPGQHVTWGSALAWMAIAAVGIGRWLGLKAIVQRVAQLVSTTLLYCSWLVNVHHFMLLNVEAEQWMALESMLLFSVLFQIATLFVFWRIVFRLSPF